MTEDKANKVMMDGQAGKHEIIYDLFKRQAYKM